MTKTRMRLKQNQKNARRCTQEQAIFSLAHRRRNSNNWSPATIVELKGVGGALRMQKVGNDKVIEIDKEQEGFIAHLQNYGGKRFWEDMQTPYDIE